MGWPSRFTPDDIWVIVAMRRKGASWRAIGAKVGRANTLCRRVWVETLEHPGGWARPRGSGGKTTKRARADNSPPLRTGDPATAIGAVQL